MVLGSTFHKQVQIALTFGLLPLSAGEMRLVMAVGGAPAVLEGEATTSETLMFASSSSTRSIEVTSGVP